MVSNEIDKQKTIPLYANPYILLYSGAQQLKMMLIRHHIVYELYRNPYLQTMFANVHMVNGSILQLHFVLAS